MSSPSISHVQYAQALTYSNHKSRCLEICLDIALCLERSWWRRNGGNGTYLGSYDKSLRERKYGLSTLRSKK